MIIPAIDLIDGQVVRLYQGDYDQQTTFDLSPLAQLQSYEAQGAKQLHLVDLTGAKDPAKRQTKLIAELAAGLNTPLQVGGGIRSVEQVEELLACGASRVVIGSLAVREPELVKSWFVRFGAEAICLALDVNINADGEKIVAVHGWQSGGGKTLESLVAEFAPVGLKHALVTDISRDGTMTGANNSLYQELAEKFPEILWQASGGIATLDDVAAVRDSGASGIIIGKALLTNQFSVQEAITCWPNA
ncbi:1-(5-phosphoribosyl)-5-[(5-phosphoribosylamino)methylideneamino]imidazole-4-carboxamide isomerase [Shewanella sp. C32]|uniref:1-(5-phosphoribosyl)-5-[(5-phosphoribosylamino)methylideneamino] imidazole-4-carboxamide isomerase n=1 Tax=Shewanella electrica TaxID=515560 RepID=A0ABT2FP10_9GAMM|nr:1-(5-phosphoribosyl)-5-[(5-phosphoribosylamino)methylideneamino]imidazole-4-carboxamide isomerase [Shewanella electrica]MCH1923720.1 1-(5-phosphoribosyl)-5-[(5-phosphoribosylamino)methylideneamino]imidazole-4-carboxamide isomerase [Shewanella electrica]MCS4556939.1 1-(5-phosphoribosyl)-5-[(5-phosphoribosylamino)methylideneamino]imidazole-4-carboxamide isomerase [Shewanella electrica]